MADWKPPPFGTPTWLAIPATDVTRGKAIARMQNFVLDYSYREMMLHVEKKSVWRIRREVKRLVRGRS